LVVTYPGPPPVRAVAGISLTVAPGECLGMLGESGSGKSTLARSVLGLLPEADVHGTVRLGDLELGSLDEDAWREVRWKRIALSFQSTTALNPVLRIGQQMAMGRRTGGRTSSSARSASGRGPPTGTRTSCRAANGDW